MKSDSVSKLGFSSRRLLASSVLIAAGGVLVLVSAYTGTSAAQSTKRHSILGEHQLNNVAPPLTPECENSWSLTSSLDWAPPADWDLHLQTPNAHIYYGNMSADGFTLDQDANPACATTPLPPEHIAGMGQCGAYTLYSNLYSTCGGSPPITFSVTVTVIKPITINGAPYAPGATFHPQDGVSFTVDATPGCSVAPLAPCCTDPVAESFEQGDTVDTDDLEHDMLFAYLAFKAGVTSAGGHFQLNSAYRPPEYQAHLREVWDKWKKLKNDTSAACQTVKSQVQAEISNHGLQNLRTRPASPSGMHTMGAAIDITVDPAITGLPLETLLQKACDAGLYRRMPITDKVHFELGPCSNPPRFSIGGEVVNAQRASGSNTALLEVVNAKQVSGTNTALLDLTTTDSEITVQVSVENLPNGNARYRYTVSNESDQDIVGFFVGEYNDDSELLTAPQGWDPDTGIPPSSVEMPTGWQADVLTTEEIPYLSLEWNAGSPDYGLHPGSTTNSFAILLDSTTAEYSTTDWTAVLADGRTISGSLGSQLANISTRAFVQTGDNVMIGGFIVQGSEPKKVIVRAIGPELTPYGVANALADPILELHDGTGALIASNNNWQDTIIGGIITSDQVQDILNSAHAPGTAKESAIIATLQAGNYTAIVRGVNNATGVALVEVYDMSPSTSSLLGNISTRTNVQTRDNVMIGGFIVKAAQAKRVIVRAVGPELSQYGVPNPMADTTLELHDGTGALIASNDNWQTTIIGGIITGDQVGDIQNSGHAPGDTRESAIIATLPTGNYTAIVRGMNNTTGVALVEVYDLQ